MTLERYDVLMKVHFSITGTEVTPSRGDPLVKKLLDKLRDYVYEWSTIVARIIDVDVEQLTVSQINQNLAEGVFGLVHWDIIDSDPDLNRRVFVFNNSIKNRLAKELMELEFKHYTTKISVTKISHN